MNYSVIRELGSNTNPLPLHSNLKRLLSKFDLSDLVRNAPNSVTSELILHD